MVKEGVSEPGKPFFPYNVALVLIVAMASQNSWLLYVSFTPNRDIGEGLLSPIQGVFPRDSLKLLSRVK